MRNMATRVVYELVKKNRDVIAITADNGNEVYDQIKKEFPKQYIDYGIAECNMVASAAGMASVGKIPFLYAVTNFMSMRAYEFIRNMICLPNYNVKFLGRSASMVTGTYGMTHQGTEDLALLRTLPNLLVITPATPLEAMKAVEFAYNHRGPVYIRLEACNEPELYESDYIFSVGKGSIIRSGNDVTVISMGSIINEVIKAANVLAKENIQVRIINMPMAKPIDTELIMDAAVQTGKILTVEEHSLFGGLGSAVSEILAENHHSVSLFRMGLIGYAEGCGNRDNMRSINKLSSIHIISELKHLLKK